MFIRNTASKILIAALLVAGVSTVNVGCKGKKGTKTEGQKTEAVAQALEVKRGTAQGETDSDTLPIGDSYVKGNSQAPITIVEFSDFQCPFCSRGNNTLTELVKKYPDKIRVAFKHYPLPFHKQAPDASYAALAAGEQGKFWEMHDLLFEKQKEINAHAADMKEWTTELAKGLGLDTAKFQTDYDTISKGSTIKDDMALGGKVGVSGTPAFFINGKRLVGAQPIDKFEEIVKSELEAIEKLGGTVKANDLYSTRVKANYEPEKPREEEKPAQVVAHVPIEKDDPVKGNAKNPLVTIVEFSDFQCPFCSRVNPTLADVEKNFGDQVRVIFKQNPLSFHQQAPGAAKAALAAGKQGKFWEMHDKLFADQKSLNDATYEKYAKELGLNVAKFKKDYASPEIDKKVKDDTALAAKVGARGTPNFFINGVQLVGAQPYPAFEAEIKKQIEIAKKLADEKKLSGEELYAEVVKVNQANVNAGGGGEKKPDKIDAAKLQQGKSYAKGPDNAPITIVEFSDFECPFCSRGTNTLNDVFKEYEGKIKVVFKNYPLPFHQAAEPAARAALAAGKQGKFWEMHDKLFANQGALKNDGIFQTYAKELGLNLDKFNKDFDSDELKQQVKADMEQGSSVGVRGTPAFFINGVLLSGAQPIAKFKEVIDNELKN